MLPGPPPEGLAISQSDRFTKAVVAVVEGRLGRKMGPLTSVREDVRAINGTVTCLRALDVPGAGGTNLCGSMAAAAPTWPTAEMRALAQAILDRMGRNVKSLASLEVCAPHVHYGLFVSIVKLHSPGDSYVPAQLARPGIVDL